MFTNEENCFIVDECCESYKKIKTSANQECVVEPQEIAEGIFIASIVARPYQGEMTVKILNTRTEKVNIKN
jgi:uncharacterized protein YcfL